MVFWQDPVALLQTEWLRARSNLHKNNPQKIPHDIKASELLWSQSLSEASPWLYKQHNCAESSLVISRRYAIVLVAAV